VENEPKTSLRHLSQQVNLSVKTCRTTLKKDLHLYPYRMTSVPELLAGDPAQRRHHITPKCYKWYKKQNWNIS
jgi:hypothetical protein